MAEESFHPRTLWDLFDVAGADDITASTDHDHKAYRDRQQVRWKRSSFRDYQLGMVVTWDAVDDNTGACTLNINGRGVKDLVDNTGAALTAGALVSGATYMATYNGTEFRLIGGAAGGGGGGGVSCTPYWSRSTGDGTDRAGSGNLTTSREEEGVYLVTSDDAFDEVGGYYQYGVLVTISTKAGDGADGMSPFLGKDTDDVVLTGNSNTEDFYYANGKLWVLCPADHKVYVHDLSSFTSAASTITPGSNIRTAGQSGCMSTDGSYIWLSGDSAYPVRAINTSTNAVTTFSTPGNLDAICLASDGTHLYTYEGSVKKYTPNHGTNNLGSVVASWAPPALNDVINNGAFDHDGNLWVWDNSTAYLIETGVTSVYSVHAWPPISAASDPTARIMPDLQNRCLYVSIKDSINADGYLYKYSGWNKSIDDSGTWIQLQRNADDGEFTGAWFDPESGVLFTKDEIATQTAQRMLPRVNQSLDSVYIDDTASPVSEQIDYDLTGSRHSFYLDNYGYVLGAKGGNTYIIRISYNGTPIGSTGGGAFITQALSWGYEIISATEAYVYIFTSESPIRFVDAEFTVEFVHCTSSEGGGGGGITMATNRLLGRTTAGDGDPEEITVTANNGLLLASLALSVDRALQSDMETPTSGNKIVASTAMLYHPGVAKAWCAFDATGSLLGPFYNIGSITDNGTGDWSVNISGSFPLSSANGTVLVTAVNATPVVCHCVARTSASAYQIKCWDLAGNPADPTSINFAILGDCS